MSAMKAGLLLAVGLAGTAVLCPLCSADARAATATPSPAVFLAATDTAQVRLHISGMTCGSCPTTARLALKRLAGVPVHVVSKRLGHKSAKMTLDVYSHVLPGQQAEAVAKLEEFLAATATSE